MEQIHKQILVDSSYQQGVKVKSRGASHSEPLFSLFIVIEKEKDSFNCYHQVKSNLDYKFFFIKLWASVTRSGHT